MKKILIITFHYPPDAAIGAVRPAKFAEYFPKYDIEPIVLTVNEKNYEKIDEQRLMDSSEHVQIFRTCMIPSFRDSYLFAKRYLWKNKQSRLEFNDSSRISSSDGDVIRTAPEGFLARLKRFLNSFVWLPDDKTGWILPAVFMGLQLIRRNNIEALYTTGPPYSVHLIGLLIKLLTRKVWIADFRDPWIVESKPTFVRSKLSETIENYLVSKVIACSDKVVSVTPEMTNYFKEKYNRVQPGKFSTIYNGYDFTDLEKYTRLEKYKKITFTYAGSFYYGRDPEPFLNELRSLIDDEKINEDGVAVRFLGNCRYLYDKSIENLVKELGLSSVVTFVDMVPHHDALVEMAKSHILLLFAPDQPLQIPGKLFEYMGLNAYILAVCGSGATANVLQDYSRAITVLPEDWQGMKKAIFDLWEKNKETGPIWNSYSLPPQFERRELTNKLSKLI